MKLYTRGRYALRLMVAVARRSRGTDAISLSTVASDTMMSRRYLEQVAKGLRDRSLLRAVSGRSGGYLLARPAAEITLAEIIEASVGRINLVNCVENPDSCLEADVCECRWVYEQLNRGLRNTLDELTLETLTRRGRLRQCKRDFPQATHGCPTTNG